MVVNMRSSAVVLLAVLSISAVGQNASQPATESLDLVTIGRIRDEGLRHSHIMEYGSGLADGIGPRLTGSPDFERGAQWCIAQLKNMGMTDAHEESFGHFGMAWTQLGTSLLLTEPSTATLLAQATPWSPATNGEVSAPVVLVPTIDDEEEFDAWKGKLAGKIILYGEAPVIDPNPTPLMIPLTKDRLDAYAHYPLTSTGVEAANLKWVMDGNFEEKVARFFADEHAIAVLRTSGEAAMFVDDTSSSMGSWVYLKEHKQALPSAEVSPDGYGRMARLVTHGVPVRVKLNIMTRFGGDVDGDNVIGEISGVDPLLRDQIVMVGGHLDSWIAGTGATDDGAGAIIALEAMRILKTLGIQPRRTIRIGLWGGEEEGELGSLGYVNKHLATVKFADSAELKDIPTWLQSPISITPKPDFDHFDVYFNADAGGGRFYGINAEGNVVAAKIFEQWAVPIKDLGFSTITLRHMESIDSVNFDMVGLPGFEMRQDLRDYDTRTHHTNLDTYERLSEPDLKQAATIMAIFIYNAAQRDAMFPRKVMPAPR